MSIVDRQGKRGQKSHELKTELFRCCFTAQDGCQVSSVKLKNRADKEIREDRLDSFGRSSAEPLNSASQTAVKLKAWFPHTVFRLNLKLPTNMGINLVCQALREN